MRGDTEANNRRSDIERNVVRMGPKLVLGGENSVLKRCLKWREFCSPWLDYTRRGIPHRKCRLWRTWNGETSKQEGAKKENSKK